MSSIIMFVIATVISFGLTLLARKIGDDLDIVAIPNNRTVHTGRIVRIGGIAIYTAFMLCSAYYLKADTQINSIFLGAFIIELMGLIDDMVNLSSKLKLLLQVVAACIVIFYGGICLGNFNIPWIGYMPNRVIAVIITLFWIVGVTNALNLIDGLDGLCGGISIIALISIAVLGLQFHRSDISHLCLLLGGSIMGFLILNFHPAKIFMGDSGSQFIGFMLSCIALLGFGYKTLVFFTLGGPLITLAIPIMDTLLAIVRRKLHHKRFDEADKGHLHHTLMNTFGNNVTKTVLILYLATALFAVDSIIYQSHRTIAIMLFAFLMLVFELFIEYTHMVHLHYRPLLATLNLFIKSEELPSFSGNHSLFKKKGNKKNEEN